MSTLVITESEQINYLVEFIKKPVMQPKKCVICGYTTLSPDHKKIQKVGVLVSIGYGIIGWSLCHQYDKFDKDMAIHIAISRAEKAIEMSPSERELYYERIPRSIRKKFLKMCERSLKYYSEND